MSPRRIGRGPAWREEPATVEALAALGPLALDPATVSRAGVVRAAFDAVHTHPVYTSIRAADDADRSTLSSLDHAAGDLARRSAEFYVAGLAHGAGGALGS